MTTKTTVKTHYQLINVENILIDKYQRPIRTTAVRKMADNFDKTLLGTVTVSKRNGMFYIIDGQHRLALAKLVGLNSLMALVYEGLSYEDEAKYFNALNGANGESRKPTNQERFNASIEAKDPVAIDISKIVEKAGYRISKTKDNGGIQAVNSIQDIYTKYGATHLYYTLLLIKSTWGGEEYAVHAKILLGVSEFMNTYKGEPNFNAKMFAKQLAKVDPIKIVREAKNDPTTNKTIIQYQNVLLRYYNNKLQKKLPNLHFAQA